MAMMTLISLRLLCLLIALTAILDCSVTATTATEKTVVSLVGQGSTMNVELPDSITVLTETNFNAYVFPKKSNRRRAWFILCYSPWCSHCRMMIPQFINASIQLEAGSISHSSFGMVDITKNLGLVNRFEVQQYPTLLYTTGKGQQWHEFRGGHSQDIFMQFAAYLQHAVDTGSFSEDVTDVDRFSQVEAQRNSSRVPCYIYVPAGSHSRPGNQNTSIWSQVIDGAASTSNIFFAVIYEAEQAANWEEAASPAYKAVVAAAKRCIAAQQTHGPDGEVLIVATDRFRDLQCYGGEWVEPAKEAAAGLSGSTDAGSSGAVTSHQMELYLSVRGFHAVEEVSSTMFSTLAVQEANYLGLLIVNGSVSEKDQGFLHVLQTVTQEWNAAIEVAGPMSVEAELRMPRVSWAYADCTLQDSWMPRFRIQESDLPAVLLVDTRRERFFKMKTRVPRFEVVKKQLPWHIGGEQQQLISQFMKDVMSGVYGAEKSSYAGNVAEFLSHYPGFEKLYELLNYEDFAFVIVCFALGFFTFLLVIGLAVEPLMEWQTERKRKAMEKQKKD